MALEIKLNQKLSQSLVMTPQLQQAIKLLQLGRTEYMEVIEKELLENPVLEDLREAEEPRSGSEGSEQISSPSAEGDSQRQDTQKNSEVDFASYFDLHADSYSPTNYSSKRSDFDEDRPSLEASVTKPEGIMSHLLWQLRTSDLPEADREIAIQIIGNLDRNGYLSATVDELAADLACDPGRIEVVLGAVQALDPPGIAARDLRECLLIQLEQQGQGASLAARVVDKHLPKLESRRYDQIAKEESVDVQQIYEAIRLIQKLEPRPGRPFIDEAPVYITPDLYVRKIGDDWVVTLNEAGMPKLRLSSQYRELLQNGKNGEGSEYLQDRIRSATWLIKSIHQRQQTIHRVAESIMRFQREFLEQGVSAMKPLVLRDVAEDVKMHESTVSRVTTNKYIHTPHGVLELKFFFSSGLRTEEGAISSESVKEKIRDLVAAEDTEHPLSDQAIVERLRADGIDIARRTVAKYREMMNILSSSRRKKVF